jgi:N-acyl-D-amino-acid deacylase
VHPAHDKLAADRLRIADRGRIVEGARADLVVFDKDRVRANASYETPRQAATGICHVLVNGASRWKTGRSPACGRAACCAWEMRR